MNHQIELLTRELCYALLGNVNKNTASVSFDCKNKSNVKVRFILKSKTELEEEMIEDAVAEFEALHGNLKTLNWDVLIAAENVQPFSNLIFAHG